jgi:catechol 2,3-dioxygenase-like lactoylglutathione lyase family enzyme
MLSGLWTIGIKVPDLERELTFHRDAGNRIILDETLSIDGHEYRVPLVMMGDKYLHLAEKMVYERELGITLPFGPTHLVYISEEFEEDLGRFLSAGATQIRDSVEVSAGFGDRKVAFLRSPSGWIFEIAKVYRHRVPDVI